MKREKTTSDPRWKRELATRDFKLAWADAFGGEEEVKSPWYLSHGDARGNSTMPTSYRITTASRPGLRDNARRIEAADDFARSSY
jgi:hypothetical protein